ncbi:hypothetical protein LP416_29630 [Polaromonas sp. P2-4]|nr:hypothetical protein LP416_29630 [Polaromonas sp. P2-4]
MSTVSALAAALAVGALVGLERGWRERERAEGSRVVGLRTFSLFHAPCQCGALAELPKN